MSIDEVEEYYEDDFEETEEDTRILRIDPKLEEAINTVFEEDEESDGYGEND